MLILVCRHAVCCLLLPCSYDYGTQYLEANFDQGCKCGADTCWSKLQEAEVKEEEEAAAADAEGAADADAEEAEAAAGAAQHTG
jgi:hypothetical protein